MYFYRTKLDIELVEDYRKIIDDMICDLNPLNTDMLSVYGGVQYNLFDSKYVQRLHPIVSEVAKRINFYLKIKDLSFSSAWTVLGEKGSYNVIHNHMEGIEGISTVLYLHSPVSNDSSGNFCFFYNDTINEIKPEVGDLIIFPAAMFHGSYPQISGLRQTLNLEFKIN